VTRHDERGAIQGKTLRGMTLAPKLPFLKLRYYCRILSPNVIEARFILDRKRLRSGQPFQSLFQGLSWNPTGSFLQLEAAPADFAKKKRIFLSGKREKETLTEARYPDA